MATLAEIMRKRIHKELDAMREFHEVPNKAYEMADNMSDDEVESMDTSDAADMCIELAQI